MDINQMKKLAGIESKSEDSAHHVQLNETMQHWLKVAGVLNEAKCNSSCEEEEEDADEEEKPHKNETIKPGASKEARKKAQAKAGQFWNINKPVDKKEEKKEKKQEKKAEPKAEKAEKAEEPATTKTRGKARVEQSKTGVIRKYLQDNPNHSKKAIRDHMVSAFGWQSESNPGGITEHGFNTLLYNARRQLGMNRNAKAIKECWVIRHCSLNSYFLHENKAMNQYQWVHYLDDNQDPIMFESEKQANEAAKYLIEFKNQFGVVEYVRDDE